MVARAIADSAEVAIVIGVLFAGSFCVLDFSLSQRLRYEGLMAAGTTMTAAGRRVGVGRVRSAPE